MTRLNIIGLFALCLVYFGCNVTSYKIIHRNEDKNEYCKSEGCKKAAKSILSNMNPSIHPCDDFYEFACGGFINKTIIPEDKVDVDSFSILNEDLEQQLHESLSEKIQPSELRPFKLVKTLYQSCMNEKQIKEQDLKPVFDKIELLGGWPVLQPEWNDTSFSWMDSVYINSDLGFSTDYFISFGIDTDTKNSSRRMLALDKASPSLSRKYMTEGLKNKIVQAYFDYMVDTAVILGAEKTQAKKELAEVLDLEIKLAEISLPIEERRNDSELYHPMSLKEVTENFPSIPWEKYLNRLLLGITEINENDLINVIEPKFIASLEKILKRTSPRVLANYVVWRVVRYSSSLTLNQKLRDRQLKFSGVVNGITEREPRWKECVQVVSGYMHLSVAALYIRKYFDDEAKKNVEKMVHLIENQLESTIENLDWMDDVTRKAAIEKINAMKSVVAYPDELANDSTVVDYYKELEINSNEYMKNILTINIFSDKKSISLLREPIVDRNDWTTISSGIAIINAFYWPNYNLIVLPAGILQGGFFDKDRPNYLNYGAIGWVAGHEITHGFDDHGSQFDEDGNLVDWWKSETKKEYLEKAKCIIQQYGNYTEVGLNLNGVNTQGENIADNGGLKMAYRAYKQYSREFKEPELRLPGLDYNPEQMFWISAANTWCTKYRPEYLKNLITTNEHSPGKFRVIGPFSNLEEFSKDFNCPLETSMNPVHKCSVW